MQQFRSVSKQFENINGLFFIGKFTNWHHAQITLTEVIDTKCFYLRCLTWDNITVEDGKSLRPEVNLRTDNGAVNGKTKLFCWLVFQLCVSLLYDSRSEFKMWHTIEKDLFFFFLLSYCIFLLDIRVWLWWLYERFQNTALHGAYVAVFSKGNTELMFVSDILKAVF